MPPTKSTVFCPVDNYDLNADEVDVFSGGVCFVVPAFTTNFGFACSIYSRMGDTSGGGYNSSQMANVVFRQMCEALQLRLAEITEMIHAASLFHDDVIDEADTRRGVPSVNKVFGNKLAILAGDVYIFNTW